MVSLPTSILIYVWEYNEKKNCSEKVFMAFYVLIMSWHIYRYCFCFLFCSFRNDSVTTKSNWPIDPQNLSRKDFFFMSSASFVWNDPTAVNSVRSRGWISDSKMPHNNMNNMYAHSVVLTSIWCRPKKFKETWIDVQVTSCAIRVFVSTERCFYVNQTSIAFKKSWIDV